MRHGLPRWQTLPLTSVLLYSQLLQPNFVIFQRAGPKASARSRIAACCLRDRTRVCGAALLLSRHPGPVGPQSVARSCDQICDHDAARHADPGRHG
jgi:hypothetical protein